MRENGKKEVGKQVHLPFKRAFQIALKNIRLRLGRSMVTASGIFLGVAFLAYVWAQGDVERAAGLAVTPEAQMRQKWLIVLALMMSTIGIANSMLMAVTERYKEIGTMKCLGALDRFVVEMFLLEGMMMGCLASLLGTLVGGGASILMAGFGTGWKVVGAVGAGRLSFILISCMLIGGFLTLLATLAPAAKAAKMPPAAALRSEV